MGGKQQLHFYHLFQIWELQELGAHMSTEWGKTIYYTLGVIFLVDYGVL